MSLINDALRKARLEAARKDVDRSRSPLPDLHHSAREPVGSLISPATVLLLALGAVAVAIIAALLISRSPTSAPESASASSEPAGIAAGPIEAPASDLQTMTEAGPEGTTAPPRAAPPAAAAGSVTATRRTEVASTDSPARRSENQAPRTEIRQESPPTARPERERSSTAEASGAPASLRREPSSERAEVSAEPIPAATGTSEPARAELSAVSAEGSLSAGAPAATQSSERVSAATETGEPTNASDDRAAPGTDRKIDAFVREATIPGIGTFRLDGIAWSSDQPFALVNGEVVSAGGFVDGVAVTEVARDRVVLSRDGFVFELRLR